MKTLSDFKRRLTLGTELTYEFHREIRVVGNTCNTVFPIPPIQKRVVSKVQSNSVAFKKEDGKESWLTWPKAADIKFPDENTAQIYQDGVLSITYKFA